MNYSGYYFDNDVYVLQPLDEFRKYEMTLEIEDEIIESQVLIAHRNSRLLKAIFASYRFIYSIK